MGKNEGIALKSFPSHHLDPRNVKFSVFTSEDIKNLSVVKVKTPMSFNSLGHPLKDGLYDQKLGKKFDFNKYVTFSDGIAMILLGFSYSGPSKDFYDACGTCGLMQIGCPGHFGSIDLPLSVVNPLFQKTLSILLRLSCLNCFSLQIPTLSKLIVSAKLQLLKEGYYSNLDDLDQEISGSLPQNFSEEDTDVTYVRDIIEGFMQNIRNRERHRLESLSKDSKNLNTKTINLQWHVYLDKLMKEFVAGKICIKCKQTIPKITVLKNRIMQPRVVKTQDGMIINRTENVPIMPEQSKEYMQKLWKNEKDMLLVLIPCLDVGNIEYPTDIFFFNVIAVPPPLVRPVTFVRDLVTEHPQTQVYKAILQDAMILRNIIQVQQDGGKTDNLPDEGRIKKLHS